MKKIQKGNVAVILIIVVILIITGIVFFKIFAKKSQAPTQEAAIQPITTTTIPATTPVAASFDCNGKTYNYEVYEINGIDVVKKIIELSSKTRKCELNIASADIGIAKKVSADQKIYDIVLYDKNDKDQSSDPFNQSVEIYKIDLNANTLAFENQFDGSFTVLGKFIDETSNLVPSGVEGWQTYRNDKYGFEFQYPKKLSNYGDFLFKVVDNGDGMYDNTSKIKTHSLNIELADAPAEGSIVRIDITSDSSILNYLKDEINRSSKTNTINNDKYIAFSREGMGDSFGYIIQHNSTYYILEVAFDDGFFEKIISTFKFTK